MEITCVTSWLKDNNYKHYQDLKSDEVLLSSAFINDRTMVVVDFDAIFSQNFSYKRYCQKQNEWMQEYPLWKNWKLFERKRQMIEVDLKIEYF